MYKNKKSQIIEWARDHVKGPSIALNTDPLFANSNMLASLKPGTKLGKGVTYLKHERMPCRLITAVSDLYVRTARGGARQWAEVGCTTGATRFTFEQAGERFSCVFAAWEHGGKFETRAIAAVPFGRVAAWFALGQQLRSLTSPKPSRKKAYVFGSHTQSEFHPSVHLGDVILPPALKSEIVTAIDGFFDHGLAAYAALKVPPFRKYLLYGKPGNGKSTLTQALAADQMKKGRVVIYISASDKYGATFSKIEQASDIAVQMKFPVFIIVEELDAYVASDETAAQVLDYLDGFEAPVNSKGTVLLATSNHPERLEDRILRFGRIDRKWLIPDLEDQSAAESMLRHCLGELCPAMVDWRLLQALIGKPRVFVRELALTARLQAAAAGSTTLSAHLMPALRTLEAQITTGDDFLRAARREMGFAPMKPMADTTPRPEDELDPVEIPF